MWLEDIKKWLIKILFCWLRTILNFKYYNINFSILLYIFISQIMDFFDFFFYAFPVVVLVGHYTFSMQRVTYNLAKEFGTMQAVFDFMLPSWLVPLQLVATVCKYSLLALVFFMPPEGKPFEDRLTVALFSFFAAGAVHIFAPLFPAFMFHRMFYNNARHVQEMQDYELGSFYLDVLRSSRQFCS
ncbi:hypothetical protein [uncultured Moraxella sp.]|uniref:hypothetical protein n=1 Tax=uncultured Moraxella sp. TaxID=263769 RepID=UPI0025EBC177|nr:hypothetical protein [uncultured Moraxella sp.]